MFLAFIAVALELAAMAFGAKVILACCKTCLSYKKFCRSDRCENITATDRERLEGQAGYVAHGGHNVKEHHSGSHSFGFLKFIGYFVMTLSFIALVGTLITMSYFTKDYQDLRRDHNGPTEQYRYDLDKLRFYSSNTSFDKLQ